MPVSNYVRPERRLPAVYSQAHIYTGRDMMPAERIPNIAAAHAEIWADEIFTSSCEACGQDLPAPGFVHVHGGSATTAPLLLAVWP